MDKTFIERAAKQSGFIREKFEDAKLPQSFADIRVFVFFGDIKHVSLTSSVILHNFIQKYHIDKYCILCSWKGNAGLFPYVDEYWGLEDIKLQETLADNAIKFSNSEICKVISKNLRQKYFESVSDLDDIFPEYYKDGFTKKYLDEFAPNNEITRFLPTVISSRAEFAKQLDLIDNKILFYPVRYGKSWQNNKEGNFKIPEVFWVNLFKKFIDNDFTPIVYQNYSTYDVSKYLGDKCVYLNNDNILNTLADFRSSGCVVDIMSGVSRLAILAQCPFVYVNERVRYVKTREFEFDDLMCGSVLHKYLFGFSDVVLAGNSDDVFNFLFPVVKNMKNLGNSKFNIENYGTISYSLVRRHKMKKIGRKFIKVERLVLE